MEEDIIEETRNDFSSPAFFIEKKNSELRLVVDYRTLNEFVLDEMFDIPKIHENIQNIGERGYFTKIDLKNGFNQLELSKESRDLTSFSVLGKQYRYLRLPFGIKCGPKLFQRVITTIIQDCKNCFVYIDDIVIFSNDEKEHNENCREILKKLYEHEVKINLDKSEFFKEEIKLLGLKISRKGIKADTSGLSNKVFHKDITSKKNVQRIVGIINWFRMFVPNLSHRISPITNFLRGKTQKIFWDNQQKETLKKIVKDVETHANLKFPNYKKKFFLHCDASDIGLGAVLFQEHGVISYYSKKLTETERNYSIVEKEFLCIIKALTFYRNIVLGYYVEISTDSRNCTYENKSKANRIERWKILLNEYNFTIKGIKGEINNVADVLSRCYNIIEEEIIDKDLSNMIEKYLVRGESEDSENKFKIDEQGRFIIEEKDSATLIKDLHEQLVHPGASAMYNTIRGVIYVPKL